MLMVRDVKNSAQSFLQLCKPLLPIIHRIKQEGGCAYAVGGSVRDLVLARIIKDLDIEIHGISLEKLEKVLSEFGPVELVGKQFGVLLIHGLSVDWAIPRQDNKGRKPTVNLDPTMTFEQAARRRDVTMNAMGINLHAAADSWNKLVREKDHQRFVAHLTIEDPYNGLDAIACKQLRAVDKHLFIEDPLRFYRVMQFVGRFEMLPDEQLSQICKTMPLCDPITNAPLAKERIFEEIKKLFLQSERPSLGFRWLNDIGRLEELFPELFSLVGAVQRSDYHPEGDVFEHTMQALDAGASLDDYKDSDGWSAKEEKVLIMLTVLCHDLGKPSTTDALLHAKGHDLAGVPLAKSLLDRFCPNETLKKAVCILVRHHMAPLTFLKSNASVRAYKRLAKKLSPSLSLRQLALVAQCDWRGRNGTGNYPLPQDNGNYALFLEHASKANVLHKPEAPILLGRHLLGEVEPGKQMGKLLDEAYEIQIEENIHDVDELKRRVIKR